MFTVAIIGRPNAGKSTLFNRLAGKKLALVDAEPGVTRDRREGEAKLGGLAFKIIDTAGLEEGDSASLPGRMRAQTEAALAAADAVFFVFDSRSGLTPDDGFFATLVRRAGKPVILIANKAEGRKGIAGAIEGFELGFGEPVALSAEHGEGFGELFNALREALPQAAANLAGPLENVPAHTSQDGASGVDGAAKGPLQAAIIGRPNAGKSTLLNRILGEDRQLTGPEPGLTRDTIGVEFEWGGRRVKMFDTAGLRKRARIEDDLEKLAAADALRAVKFAEVVVLLVDATRPFEKQDLALADLAAREGRALLIGLNKWDLTGTNGSKLSDLRQEAERLLPQLRGMPAVPVSGKTGEGIDRLMDAIFSIHAVWNKRISTAKLNRWLEETVAQTPPPAVAGRRIKIRYITQLRARPPYFILFGNQLDALPVSYERFLVNGLRQSFGLPGVPIRISKKMSSNPYAGKRARRA
jgi:GTP-binding protein